MCVASVATSALMTAAWRCRKTNTVDGAPSHAGSLTADLGRNISRQLQVEICNARISTCSHLFAEKQPHEEGAKRKRGPAKSVCPYNKALALRQMRDEVLGTVSDIEQLLKLGRETHSCPYYSTRLAIPPAQVTQCSLYCLSTASHCFKCSLFALWC